MLFIALQRFVQCFLEELAWLEVGFPPCRNVDNVTSAGISRCRFGLGVFNLENAETSDFDPVALDQAFSHRSKDTVNHFGRKTFLASCFHCDVSSQILFCGRHEILLNGQAEALRAHAAMPIRDTILAH